MTKLEAALFRKQQLQRQVNQSVDLVGFAARWQF